MLAIVLVMAMLPIAACTLCPCAHASPSNQMVLKAQPCHHGCCPDTQLSPGQTCRADIRQPSDLVRPGESAAGTELFQMQPAGRILTSSESDQFEANSSPHSFTQDSPIYILLSVFRI